MMPSRANVTSHPSTVHHTLNDVFEALYAHSAPPPSKTTQIASYCDVQPTCEAAVQRVAIALDAALTLHTNGHSSALHSAWQRNLPTPIDV
jgi:hypothetical protein